MRYFLKVCLSPLLVLTLLATAVGCGQSSTEPAPVPVSTPPTPTPVQPYARFTAITGKVSVLRMGTSGWADAEVGMTLGKDDTVRTVANSAATIIFFEGSVIEVDGTTEIKIAELSVNQNATNIKIRQELGKTVNRVEKLVDPASRYEVETPAGSIVVRGSQGIVIVLPNGITNVQNIEGLWCVSAMGQEVCIPRGMGNNTVPGQPPGPPEAPNPPAWPPPPAPPNQTNSPLPPPLPATWSTWTQTTYNDFYAGTSDNVTVLNVAGNGTVSLARNTRKDQFMEQTQGSEPFPCYGSEYYLAQTFTAGITGSLVMVDLYLWKQGTPESLVIELRNCVNIGDDIYAPGVIVLDAIVVPASSISDQGTVYQFSFLVPQTIIAGTRYALVLHQFNNGGDSNNYYEWLLNYSSQYSGGLAWQSNNGGLIWSESGYSGEDFYFATYVASYAVAGTLESSSFDTGKASEFRRITWNSTTLPNTDIKFQIAANNDNATWNFVGPDGTSTSYYETSGAIITGHNGNRYIKYKAFLSTTNTGITPLLNSVTIEYR